MIQPRPGMFLPGALSQSRGSGGRAVKERKGKLEEPAGGGGLEILGDHSKSREDSAAGVEVGERQPSRAGFEYKRGGGTPSSTPFNMAANADQAGLKVAAVDVPSNEYNERRTRDGKWTLRQLRQSDAIVPLQSGTNQFDSQRGKTGFGMPRNTQTAVQFADGGKKWNIDQLRGSDAMVRLQSGTNQYESQKGMTGFGTPRDVKGKHLKRIWEIEFPDEAIPDQLPPQANGH